jgi:type II secretory pathway component GspD/PulD (secretin)
MTMLDIVNTLSEIWKMTYSQPGVIQFHEKAELLIVSGTDDQNDFIRETLQAMRMKAQMEHGRQAHTESKTNDSSPKVQIR